MASNQATRRCVSLRNHRIGIVKLTVTFSTTFRFLGILAGGMSLFILAQTAFEFGMSEAFGSIVDYYRGLIYPVLSLLAYPLTVLLRQFGIDMPAGWQDWLVLYSILASAFFRARIRLHKKHESTYGRLEEVMISQVLKATAWPLFFCLYLITASDKNVPRHVRRPWKKILDDEGRRDGALKDYRSRVRTYLNLARRFLIKNFLLEACITLSAFILFFALNAAI